MCRETKILATRYTILVRLQKEKRLQKDYIETKRRKILNKEALTRIIVSYDMNFVKEMNDNTPDSVNQPESQSNQKKRKVKEEINEEKDPKNNDTETMFDQTMSCHGECEGETQSQRSLHKMYNMFKKCRKERTSTRL